MCLDRSPSQSRNFSGREALSVSKRLWIGCPLGHLAPLDRRPSQSGDALDRRPSKSEGLYQQENISRQEGLSVRRPLVRKPSQSCLSGPLN